MLDHCRRRRQRGLKIPRNQPWAACSQGYDTGGANQGNLQHHHGGPTPLASLLSLLEVRAPRLHSQLLQRDLGLGHVEAD